MAAAPAAATAAAAWQQRHQLQQQQQLQRHQPPAVPAASLMNHFGIETLALIFAYGHNPYSDASWVQLLFVSRTFAQACQEHKDHRLDLCFTHSSVDKNSGKRGASALCFLLIDTWGICIYIYIYIYI